MLTPLNKSLCRTITQALIILAAVFSVTSPSGAQEESRSAGDPTTERIEGVAKRSAFGVYQGYSVAKYNGWERTTQYVAMRDGVRLAVDVMLPSVDGIIADAPIPTIMILQRYGRAYIFANRDGVVTPVEGYPVVRELVKNGYALVSIGIRGTGASFGTFPGVQSANEARDAYDMVEWITKQPWSNGMVGMMGNSYRANAAMMAATSPHPALKAAFPSMIDFDNYETSRPGGILLSGPLKSWTYLTGVFDGRLPSGDDPRFPKVAPVEGEDGQTLFEQARAEHASNVDVLASSIEREYRDDYEYENVPQEDQNVLASLIEPINEGNIAIYFWSGWRDIWPKQPFLWMSNLTVPRKLTIGPWTHDADDRNPETRSLLKRENERNRLETIEALRWFDFWLKGIENGIMDESPYQIAVLNDVDNWKWISVDRWPIAPKKRSTALRLQLDKNGIERELSATTRAKVDQEFSFDVDFSATTGPRSRWKDATSFGGFIEPDIDAIAETGLAFVS
ncbi:MAG: CocE/NonD family hydrolase, partial [Pseudomonadota bacterium]